MNYSIDFDLAYQKASQTLVVMLRELYLHLLLHDACSAIFGGSY
jgi:hypothetical protein